MGLDVCIDFAFAGTDAELNDLAYDLARRVDPDFFCEHPCIKLAEDDPGYASVRTWERYWGPGYERGRYPLIRACVTYLLGQSEAGRIGAVWYYGDSSSREDGPPTTRADIADLDRHFEAGHWSYRWNRRSLMFGDGLDELAPLDVYGKPMRRHGWGGSFAAFHSLATTERREWRDGEWVD